MHSDSKSKDVLYYAEQLGPLAPLAGIWEGDQGQDVAPAAQGAKESKYRERITFEPLGPVKNGAQVLYGLRYATTAWRLGEAEAFHEEVGYWLWDATAGDVMRCFIVPRGVVVNAGGKSQPAAKEFSMQAECGSTVFGVLSNPYLEQNFKTVRYELKVTVHDENCFSYWEDTQLMRQPGTEIFHHTDQNKLIKV